MPDVDELFRILEHRGATRYGSERVSQLEHALQCACLGVAADNRPALVTAALFHDIGHLVHPLGDEAAARGIDDRHERVGEKYLSSCFGEAVSRPVALHVDAKRYLCSMEPDYLARLSTGSIRSLELQGGSFGTAESEVFRILSHAEDAIRLRRWDDQAKVVGRETPDLAHFRSYVEAAHGLA